MIRAYFAVVLFFSVCLSGCGGSAEPKKNPAMLDAVELLKIVSEEREKTDPKSLMEAKLGDFKITHVGDKPDTLVTIKFALFSVLAEDKKADLDTAMGKNEQRMRDAVLSLVHKTKFASLADPSLGALKSELVLAVNQMLETNVVRDLVFSSFSIERG